MDYTAFWNGCQTANERKVKSMREMYIEEITKNLNVLSEHFLKCVWIFTSNLASEKKGGAR
jgi:hypothetical protein